MNLSSKVTDSVSNVTSPLVAICSKSPSAPTVIDSFGAVIDISPPFRLLDCQFEYYQHPEIRIDPFRHKINDPTAVSIAKLPVEPTNEPRTNYSVTWKYPVDPQYPKNCDAASAAITKSFASWIVNILDVFAFKITGSLDNSSHQLQKQKEYLLLS